MSKITAYKCLQADGNRALAAEVQRFINEGWEPHEGLVLMGVSSVAEDEERAVDSARKLIYTFAQPIVRREAESAELKRLREMETWIAGIVEQLDNPITNEFGMLTFAHESCEKALRGGPYERKPPG